MQIEIGGKDVDLRSMGAARIRRDEQNHRIYVTSGIVTLGCGDSDIPFNTAVVGEVTIETDHPFGILNLERGDLSSSRYFIIKDGEFLPALLKKLVGMDGIFRHLLGR